jgi:hypothetical protein
VADLADFYTDRLRKHFKTLYAVWPPGRPVQLGDIGVLKDDVFVPKRALRHFGIGFSERSDTQSAHYEFSSSDSTEIVTHLSGSGPVDGPVLVNGGIEVNFSSEKSVFFNAAGCLHHAIEDQVALADAVMKHYEEGTWDDAYAVVTEVVDAGATTVLAAGGSNASVVLEAKAKAPTIDLADASLRFVLRRQKNIGLKVISEDGLTPLIGLSKIQSKGILWTRRDEFEALAMHSLSLAGDRAAAAEQGIAVREAFFFGRC